MKLSTTTGDFKGYADTMARQLALFQGTGFRVFDLSLYNIIYEGSPFLEPGDRWKKQIDEVGETAAKLGFTFSISHSPQGKYFSDQGDRDNLILATKRSIEACSMLGIKDIVVHNHTCESFTPLEYLKANREFNSLFFEDMEKHDVNVLVENGTRRHSHNSYLYSGAELREYIQYVNHPKIFACWDTGHAHMDRDTVDQYESLIVLGDLLRGVHIADNLGYTDDHTAPYFGTCNFAPIIQALLDIDFKGTFNFESTRIVHDDDAWPNKRIPWEYGGKKDDRLAKVPLNIKWKTVALCYEIGRYMLEQYDCYEY